MDKIDKNSNVAPSPCREFNFASASGLVNR